MYGIVALMAVSIVAALIGLYTRYKQSPKRYLHLVDLLTIILVSVMFGMSLQDMPGNIMDDNCVSPGITAIKTIMWSVHMLNMGLDWGMQTP
jgi:hypothetical protein